MVNIYAANWILTGRSEPLQNMALVVKDHRIFEIGRIKEIESKYSNRVHDFGNAIIFPGFVNVHTHLELTHLRGRFDQPDGFIPWMRATRSAMASSSEEDILEGIETGIRELYDSGTLAVGDISGNHASVEPLHTSGLFARIFHEVQGFRNFRIQYDMPAILKRLREFENSEKVSNHLSPHSPYLVGRKLFQEIEQRETLISLHLASLPEETEFFQTGTGKIKQFLLANEMFDYKWEIPGTSPVRYFFDNYYYAQNNILVHMIHVSDEDMDFMAETHVNNHICLCPRSHNTLGLGVAPAEKYVKRGFNLCLGTDNVVASGDYNLRNEMQAAADLYRLSPETLLRMATVNGAVALGFEEELGTIDEGKCGRLLVMENPFGVDKDPYEALLESDKPFQWVFDYAGVTVQT